MACETKNFTCVQCPMGCPLTVTLEDGVVTKVAGNTCPRGKKYGESEATHPVRVVTSLVAIEDDYHVCSVKTDDAIPKEKVDEVLAAIGAASVRKPIVAGEVVCANVAGTGVNVVATKNIA